MGAGRAAPGCALQPPAHRRRTHARANAERTRPLAKGQVPLAVRLKVRHVLHHSHARYLQHAGRGTRGGGGQGTRVGVPCSGQAALYRAAAPAASPAALPLARPSLSPQPRPPPARTTHHELSKHADAFGHIDEGQLLGGGHDHRRRKRHALAQRELRDGSRAGQGCRAGRRGEAAACAAPSARRMPPRPPAAAHTWMSPVPGGKSTMR